MSEDGKTNARRRQSAATFSIVAAPSNCWSSMRRSYLVLWLPVEVVEVLDAADHAEPAPRDLVRARVEAHVVRLPRPVHEHRAAVVAGDEVMRDPGARRARDDVARPQVVRLVHGTAFGPARRRREVERRRALEDDEDLLLLGVAVRDGTDLAGCDLLPGEPREDGAVETRPGLIARVLELDLVDVPEVLRARLRRPDVQRGHARLDVPRIVVASLHPRPAEPDRPRARKPPDLRRMARSVDEVLEPVGAGDERVLEVVRDLHHAVARAHLVHVAVLPEEARAGEDVVDLLGRAVRMRRRGQLSRRDEDA